jgi:6-phospho-beta-glucosidase
MALRSIHVMQGIVADMEAVCPGARLFNYTNPVNLVAEAITHHSAIPMVSLCEGPIYMLQKIAKAAGLDPERVDAAVIGLNHGSWSAHQHYDGKELIPLLAEPYERLLRDPHATTYDKRLLELALMMGSIPNDYFFYYYYKDEILAELQAKPTTRSQDIMASVPDYWAHYKEQAARDVPELDPKRSRGGINELELALDVMDAIFNDRREVWPVNVPNQGAIADFPDDMVVEVPGFVDRNGIAPVAQGHMPRQVVGLVKMLGEYQALAAEAAWSGRRIDGIRALAANPLVLSTAKATVLYDEMAAAHHQYLPDRLLH